MGGKHHYICNIVVGMNGADECVCEREGGGNKNMTLIYIYYYFRALPALLCGSSRGVWKDLWVSGVNELKQYTGYLYSQKGLFAPCTILFSTKYSLPTICLSDHQHFCTQNSFFPNTKNQHIVPPQIFLLHN